MSTQPTNDPAALQASIDKLTETLRKAREDHKAEKAAILAPVRKALGLGDDAGSDAILSALTAKAPDAEPLIAERTKALTAERDAAVAERDTIKAERTAERISGAIASSLGKSGMIPANHEDAATMLRGILEVNAAGAIVTKAAANVLPGQTPDQYIVAQLRTLRPHWWATSQGGGATGGRNAPPAGDVSVFDPRSPNWSVTKQAQFEARFGADRARAAARQFGTSLAGERRR